MRISKKDMILGPRIRVPIVGRCPGLATASSWRQKMPQGRSWRQANAIPYLQHPSPSEISSLRRPSFRNGAGTQGAPPPKPAPKQGPHATQNVRTIPGAPATGAAEYLTRVTDSPSWAPGGSAVSTPVDHTRGPAIHSKNQGSAPGHRPPTPPCPSQNRPQHHATRVLRFLAQPHDLRRRLLASDPKNSKSSPLRCVVPSSPFH